MKISKSFAIFVASAVMLVASGCGVLLDLFFMESERPKAEIKVESKISCVSSQLNASNLLKSYQLSIDHGVDVIYGELEFRGFKILANAGSGDLRSTELSFSRSHESSRIISLLDESTILLLNEPVNIGEAIWLKQVRSIDPASIEVQVGSGLMTEFYLDRKRVPIQLGEEVPVSISDSYVLDSFEIHFIGQQLLKSDSTAPLRSDFFAVTNFNQFPENGQDLCSQMVQISSVSDLPLKYFRVSGKDFSLETTSGGTMVLNAVK
jgi:hypothetical protein